MQQPVRSPYLAYIAAILGAAIVLAMTAPSAAALSPFIAVAFVVAVLVAAVLGGGKPGLVCTFLIVFGWHFTFGHGISRAALDPRYILLLLTYLTIGAIISFLSEALIQAWHRIADRQRLLEQEIADRIRAEEESRERAERLRVTLSSIGDAVITTDVASKITAINPVAEALTAWKASEAEGRLLGEVFHIINERTRSPVDNPCEKVLRTGVVVGLANHTLLISRDGREIPVDDSAAPIKDTSGQVLGVVLVFRDASREREATAALQQLASIVENSDDAIISKTIDGRITSWNLAAERLYGFTAAEAIGRNIEIIVPAEKREELSQFMSRLAAGQRVSQLDTARRRKDGSLVHVSLQISPIRDSHGTVIGASKIARDVTERKYMEDVLGTLARASGALASLTDRESALRRAVDSVVPFFADWCLVVKLDRDGNLQEFVAGHHDSHKQLVLDKLIQTRRFDWSASTLRALQTGETQFVESATAESSIDAACDEEAASLARALDVRSVISVPLDIRGKTIGAITFVASDADRRYRRRDVGFAEDLARRLAIAIDNSELLESLRAADRQKNVFLAMLAHELRNPLGAIGYANALIPTSDAHTQAELIALVDRQVRNLAHLIDGLLDVSRITRDKIQLRREYFDGIALLRRVTDVVRPLIESKRHRFTLEVQAESIPLYADITRVEQILTNVLSNAIKYTHEGGDISLTASTNDGHVDIRVKDTGIGISKEMLPHVFDLFSQAEQGLDRSQGGLGIGLTIAKKLTELQGGTLAASSAGIGHGAEFKIRLPLSAANQADPDTLNGACQDAGKKLRLLVVDDDRDTVRTQSLFLSSIGHTVESAYDGQTAVAVAEWFRPHAVLLDLGLPGMNGFEVAKALRSQGYVNETMIAISGYGRPEDKRRCEDAGFDYHFTKPIDQNALVRTLQNVRVLPASDELEKRADVSD